MPQHELDAYGQLVNMVAHLLGESFKTEEAGVVFFCGDNHLGFWHGGKLLVELADILFGELVMVGKGHRHDVADEGLEVDDHLFG